MAPYIHSKREGNHIIDLTKTGLKPRPGFGIYHQNCSEGKQVLLVSTKHQAKEQNKEGPALATEHSLRHRGWLGGMLTNTATMGARIKHLKDLESRMIDGELGARYSNWNPGACRKKLAL